MKFSNGCWLQKEACECFSPAEVYFSKIEENAVTICAPASKIRHRGDTLGGVNLTIRVTAPYPEVLRIQTWHHMGLQDRGPHFELSEMHEGLLAAEETEDCLSVSCGSLRFEMRKDNGTFAFFRGGEKITSSDTKDLAYIHR